MIIVVFSPNLFTAESGGKKKDKEKENGDRFFHILIVAYFRGFVCLKILNTFERRAARSRNIPLASPLNGFRENALKSVIRRPFTARYDA